MPRFLDVTSFLTAPGVVLDVRSPGEYAHGHLPGAIRFPLFSDGERAQVGICYKQQGREAAIELGLTLVGPKCADFVRQARALVPDRRLRLHCWRGGMRSEAMAQLLQMAGFEVMVLAGGYKAFRRWVLNTLQQPRPIVILAGMTGTGKTAALEALAQQGAQVLDLEQWANHRGSSYGGLGLPAQPTTEHFENQLAMQWRQLDDTKLVWIEAESNRIGTCRIPESLFQQMERSPVIELQRSRPERLALLADLYGTADRQALVAATERIRKRLGGLRTQQAIDRIQQNDPTACEIILEYYDKTYTYDLQRRQSSIHSIDVTGLSASETAQKLLHLACHLEYSGSQSHS